MVIDGTHIAEGILARLKKLRKPEGFFGAALVGNDAASLNFLKQKEKTGKALGIDFHLYQLPSAITTDELRAEIGRLVVPKNCAGFIVQLPLPEKINRHYALNAIPKEKDVDFLSEAALGAFYTGRAHAMPPSAGVVEEILKLEKRDLRDLTVVMVGAGFLIGKPVGFWLQNRVAELMVLDNTVKDVHARLAEADIVISGAGQPGLFSAKHLKKGAVVIDFGFSAAGGKVAGDFNPAGADAAGIHYTKTPGGTGPVLVAKLFENFYVLNNSSNGAR
ncbi:MAG TPA: bifunctional 5,10-methylenetetrahydrofolate dehydrogenase/5,10-methenyltetrahydrofolate cyclohydrolase [Candidatus Paceibacterota bacterium]|jgi:methylenetetrahydrofolate dehydrogenase (NADP+)/methenyltetrahydrofolate cyclohydrolase|nr:bifunctional 5,10-methylenetetrahydrofolate dehydrogenase/5,10-methenyltetrahydrofolate cyclohydrolase [Candidatus Paceibacterota bacterium]